MKRKIVVLSFLGVIAAVAVSSLAAAAPLGAVTEFTVSLPGTSPAAMAAGPDGNMWFTDGGARAVGRITPGGTVTEFPVTASSALRVIALGADGNFWFADAGTPAPAIGRITPSGAITE